MVIDKKYVCSCVGLLRGDTLIQSGRVDNGVGIFERKRFPKACCAHIKKHSPLVRASALSELQMGRVIEGLFITSSTIHFLADEIASEPHSGEVLTI